MENKKIFSIETKNFSKAQIDEYRPENKNNYNTLLEISRPSLNVFESSSKPMIYSFGGSCFDAEEVVKNEYMMFSEENPFRSLEENRGLEYNFNFDSTPMKAAQDNFELSFNSPLEYSFPELARSYENELTYDIDFCVSPRCLSHNEIYEDKSSNRKNFGDKIANAGRIHPKNKRFSGADESFGVINNCLSKLEERKSSSSCSPISYDEEKLHRLLQCLKKTKGVNHKVIDEDIISKTMEFGQQKVAEMLNIPYRRYKSILGKVGIKSSAGRKIKSTNFEIKLVEWANMMKFSSSILTRKMLRNKATNIINELIESGESNLRKVRLSKGWLDKFVKRHPDIKDYLTSQKGKKS